MILEKCALCEHPSDPRFGAVVDRRSFELCDGCGGPENAQEAADLFARLRALPVEESSSAAGGSDG